MPPTPGFDSDLTGWINFTFLSKQEMQLLDEIYPVQPDEYAQIADVWEASVRATHHFVSEADIRYFRPKCLIPQIRI